MESVVLSVSEIANRRTQIEAMPATTAEEKAKKEQAYLDLQWVVPYQSQRGYNTAGNSNQLLS